MQLNMSLLPRIFRWRIILVIAALMPVIGCGGGSGGVITLVPNKPTKPANLTATSDPTAKGGAGAMIVSWDISKDATSYNVYRDHTDTVDATKFNIIPDGSGITTTVAYDGSVQDGTTYTYHVVAHNATGDSAPSDDLARKYLKLPGLTVDPAVSSLDLNATETLTPKFSGADSPAITWTILEGATGGGITPAGVYTAPGTPGTYHIQAQATIQGSTVIAIATVQAGLGSGSGTVTIQ